MSTVPSSGAAGQPSVPPTGAGAGAGQPPVPPTGQPPIDPIKALLLNIGATKAPKMTASAMPQKRVDLAKSVLSELRKGNSPKRAMLAAKHHLSSKDVGKVVGGGYGNDNGLGLYVNKPTDSINCTQQNAALCLAALDEKELDSFLAGEGITRVDLVGQIGKLP